MSTKDEGNHSSHRRLGRGIGALLSVPVRVPGEITKTRPAPSSVEPPSDEFGQAVGQSGTSFEAVSLTKSPASAVSTHVPRGTLEGSSLTMVPVAEVIPNPRQPRRDFDEDSLRALAESIRVAGLMQPVLLRRISSQGPSRFELIAGERRWRASKLLGLAEIPAIVRDLGDQASAEWALIENIQREDLNPIERSEAIGRLVEDFSLTHQDLADRLAMDRVTITNLLRLLDLDAFTKDAVRRGVLSQGHAKVLLGVADAGVRKALASAVISSGLSVRELEKRVRETGSGKRAERSGSERLPTTKPHIADLERRLSEHLGTKVQLAEKSNGKGSGQLIIDYYSLDQFDGLMARIGFFTELT